MCGIVGYVGNQDAVPILLNGLSKLEYRGYDSAGVAIQRGEKIEIRPVSYTHLDVYKRQPQANAFFSSSFTFPGFALPPDAFITCPTRNPSTCCLPSLNCPTWAGFFFKTSSIIVAKAPSSETCVSPFSWTIRAGALPEA